jgi:hypothetical protein
MESTLSLFEWMKIYMVRKRDLNNKYDSKS